MFMKTQHVSDKREDTQWPQQHIKSLKTEGLQKQPVGYDRRW
jgi:hypothetical protein